jgi:hypothetical protein
LRQNDDTSDGHNTHNLTVFLPRADGALKIAS